MSDTFESLASCDAEALEHILRRSTAPDPQRLIGTIYNGYNHHSLPLGRTNAIKFRKAFFVRDGAPHGVNQMVQQDGKDSTGAWQVQEKAGKPVELGFYSVGPVPDRLGKHFDPYRHLLGLDYNVDPNPRLHFLMRSIYDFVGLPNDGDYDLLLGKAFLRLMPGMPIAASYFVLGHPEPYTRSST